MKLKGFIVWEANGLRYDMKQNNPTKKYDTASGTQSKKPTQAVRGEKTEKKREKDSPCPVQKKCGGCQYLNLSYAEQLEKKEKEFRRLMQPFCKPEPIIGMENPYHYRHKVHAVFGMDRKHQIISGNYEENSHRLVAYDSCLLEHETADRIICTVRELMKSFKYTPYNEDTGYGLMRHILIRVGCHTGEIMVVLVLASPILPSKNNFVKALLAKHPEISTIVLNINNRHTSMVLGERDIVLYGKGFIEDSLLDRVFRISPQSFYQVNPVQTEKLYQKALDYAQLTGKERVLDAYCGTGTIGILASAQAGEVLGVELNPAAVRDAVTNAKRNQVTNIRFIREDAGNFMMKYAEEEGKVDVLLMDPPRSGSSPAFLSAVSGLKPERVVYISCNPETLVRDLAQLVKYGYKVKKAVGVDMFPWTTSLEAVVLLSKGMVDSRKVKVDFSLEDIDLSEFKGFD